MKKKFVAVILIIITIFYIIIGALLLINIQFMDAPEILVEAEISKLSSEEAVLNTIITVDNPNGFDIIAKNIKLVVTTPDGYEAARTSLEGGKIRANDKTIFTKDISIAFNGRSPEHLITKISGEVGASILFIEKTIPLKVGIVTSIENLLNNITAPSISVTANIDDITTEGVNLSAEIIVNNPNSFDINVGNITAVIENDDGEKVGGIDIEGGVIPGNDYIELNGTGWLLFDALNAENLLITMSAEVGVKVAGFEKNLPITLKAGMKIPDLKEFLLPNDVPTVLAFYAERKITLQGFINTITLEVDNTFKVDLVLRDIHVKMFLVADDTPQLLAENVIEGESLCPTGKVSTFITDVNFGFAKLFTINLNSDWELLTVSANLTIRGLDPAVYLEIRGYQDSHIIR